jgi:hypothetical protein
MRKARKIGTARNSVPTGANTTNDDESSVLIHVYVELPTNPRKIHAPKTVKHAKICIQV